MRYVADLVVAHGQWAEKFGFCTDEYLDVQMGLGYNPLKVAGPL